RSADPVVDVLPGASAGQAQMITSSVIASLVRTRSLRTLSTTRRDLGAQPQHSPALRRRHGPAIGFGAAEPVLGLSQVTGCPDRARPRSRHEGGGNTKGGGE